jgi:hypothetical protein
MSSGDYDVTFREHMKDMSRTARASLNASGLPLDIRNKIIDQTPYSNSVKRSIEFFKENIGERLFMTLLWALSSPQYLEVGEKAQPLTAYQSWLIEISEQFIDLLKFTPDLPPILIPFREIIQYYLPEVLEPPLEPYDFSNEVYIQKCNEIVERFITETKLNPESKLVKKIKHFFNSVVGILIEFLKKNKTQIERESSLRRRYQGQQSKSLEVRMGINSRFIMNMFQIFETLFELNKNPENRSFIIDINLREWLKYGKTEKEFIISKLKRENPEEYEGYTDGDWDWRIRQYAEELEEERDARRQAQRATAAEGGRKNKIRNKTISSKKKFRLSRMRKKKNTRYTRRPSRRAHAFKMTF